MKYLFVLLGVFLISASSSNSPTDEELVASLSVPGTGLTAKHERDHKLRIESVVIQDNNKPIITIEGQEFEVSPFSEIGDAWIRGQRVEITQGKKSSYYNIDIKNLDNGETVKVRRLDKNPTESQF